MDLCRTDPEVHSGGLLLRHKISQNMLKPHKIGKNKSCAAARAEQLVQISISTTAGQGLDHPHHTRLVAGTQ